MSLLGSIATQLRRLRPAPLLYYNSHFQRYCIVGMEKTSEHFPSPADEKEELRIVQARKEDRENVVNFMLSDFLYQEPLSMSLNATPEEARPFFNELIDACLPSHASYLVLGENNQIAAMAINKVASLSDDGTFEKIDSSGFEPKLSKLADVLNSMLQYLVDHREEFGLPAKRDYLEVEILSVHKASIGRGFARKLVNASIELAKDRGCAFAATVATNIASQQLFSKLGFETLHTLMHKEYLDKQGQRIFDCKSNPTDCVKLMVKRW